MSHIVNDIYIEHMRERFDELKDGTARMSLLVDLKWQGFDSLVEHLLEEWHQERAEWLFENNLGETDIHVDYEDEVGKEFYFDIDELGTPGDDYQVTTKKSYLPFYLNVNYWLAQKL